MKRIVILLFVLASISLNKLEAQKIMMKVDGLNLGEGEMIKALEWKPGAEVTSGAGGTTTSRADPRKFNIKKNAGRSTDLFFQRLVSGSLINFVEFAYFETDTSKDPYYILKLEQVNITDLFWLSPECPTCLQLEHQVGFAFSKITIHDKKNNLIKLWNLENNTVTTPTL